MSAGYAPDDQGWAPRHLPPPEWLGRAAFPPETARYGEAASTMMAMAAYLRQLPIRERAAELQYANQFYQQGPELSIEEEEEQEASRKMCTAICRNGKPCSRTASLSTGYRYCGAHWRNDIGLTNPVSSTARIEYTNAARMWDIKIARGEIRHEIWERPDEDRVFQHRFVIRPRRST